MKVAVIDMGTNTFHLIIVEVKSDDFEIVYRLKNAVKIGEKGINQGMITDEAIERALTTLTQFKKITSEHGVNQTFATATSAIRNARNGQQLVDLIKEQIGIEARIISGLQEAEYIYLGVKKALPIGSKPALIMDIGGGSIEFIIGTRDEVLWKQSFEVGGQRMVEKFQKNDPMTEDQRLAQRDYLDQNLAELFEACDKHKPKTLIGSSGTFDTLSDIFQVRENIKTEEGSTEYPLTIVGYQSIHNELITKNKVDRLKIPGMIPLRVDMIVVASVLIEYILEHCAIDDIRVSAYALKEGVLLSTLSSLEA